MDRAGWKNMGDGRGIKMLERISFKKVEIIFDLLSFHVFWCIYSYILLDKNFSKKKKKKIVKKVREEEKLFFRTKFSFATPNFEISLIQFNFSSPWILLIREKNVHESFGQRTNFLIKKKDIYSSNSARKRNGR